MLVGQLEAKLSQLAAAEQAAAADAAEVRTALQEAQLVSIAAAQAAGQEPLGQAGAHPRKQPDGVQPAAANPSHSSLGKQVGTAVAALRARVHSLEQQVAKQQAALEQAQQRPAMVAAAVQCGCESHSDAAVQAEPGSGVPASTQTVAAVLGTAADAGPTAGYGQAQPEQQQMAELTQHLADARLTAVAAKAEQAAAQSRLRDAERQVGCTSNGFAVFILNSLPLCIACVTQLKPLRCKPIPCTACGAARSAGGS